MVVGFGVRITMLRKVYTKFHYVFATDCTDFNGLILCGGGFWGSYHYVAQGLHKVSLCFCHGLH